MARLQPPHIKYIIFNSALLPTMSTRLVAKLINQENRCQQRWRCGGCLFELDDDVPLMDIGYKEVSAGEHWIGKDEVSFPFDRPFDEPFDRDSPSSNKEKLMFSADRECDICRSILNQLIVSEGGLDLFADVHWARGKLKMYGGKGVDLQLFVEEDHTSYPNYPFQFHPFVDVGNYPSGDPDSSLAWDRLTRWYNQCLHNHPKCQEQPEPSYMPERLLLIEGHDPVRVRLISDAKKPPPQSYACLSHRWGRETEEHRFTTINAEAFYNGIPNEHLYLMIKDAVKVAHRLGIRYLWVDSFCICQDDGGDWHRQAPEMASIYENAAITILALSCGSEPGNRTLFSKWPPQHTTKLCTRSGRDIFARLVEHKHHPVFGHSSEPRILFGNPTDYPLALRAWVYQEQMLSRRTIHYTKRELIWECREAVLCECRHDEDALCSLSPRSQHLTSNSAGWKELVYDYTGRELTKEEDRLPALAGIARRFGEAHGWTYAAGLWKEEIMSQLLWAATGKRPRQRTFGVPSWSWASVPSSASYPAQHTEEKVVIDKDKVQVEIIPGPNPYGIPIKAEIQLDGPCVSGTIEHNNMELSSGTEFKMEDGSIEIYHDYDFWGSGDNQRVGPGTEALFLAIRACYMDQYSYLDGLILISISSYYERVGFGRTPNSFTVNRDSHVWKTRRITLIYGTVFYKDWVLVFGFRWFSCCLLIRE